MAAQDTEDFKKDAVRYWKKHSELGVSKCAIICESASILFLHGVSLMRQMTGALFPEAAAGSAARETWGIPAEGLWCAEEIRCLRSGCLNFKKRLLS